MRFLVLSSSLLFPLHVSPSCSLSLYICIHLYRSRSISACLSICLCLSLSLSLSLSFHTMVTELPVVTGLPGVDNATASPTLRTGETPLCGSKNAAISAAEVKNSGVGSLPRSSWSSGRMALMARRIDLFAASRPGAKMYVRRTGLRLESFGDAFGRPPPARSTSSPSI